MASISESVRSTWSDADRGTRLVLGGLVLLIVAAAIWGMTIVLRDNYRTLFTQLSDGDAAAIVDALKREKVPYKLSEGGTTISVPEERVHETRLGLMSSNVALSGNVGFEIFDKQGLGATEQSQRVSFQRALQGELSRTIAAFENVKQARVHLVLPESTLFKRDRQEATAAVTLTMEPGTPLQKQQILGVQRLVAASVPGLDPSRVTVTDHRGIALSAVADTVTGGTGALEARLELQREVEAHIAQKVAAALDHAYGRGQALISVAVSLSFDAIKTTTQDLVPVRGAGNSSEGGMTRRKQTTSGAQNAGDGDGNGRSSSTMEVEFDYGRRVEEVIAAPGAVKRMTIGIIVPPRIDAEEQVRLREFVVMAAGVDPTRGDLVSVQSLSAAQGVHDTGTAADAMPGEPLDAAPSATADDYSLSPVKLQPAVIVVAALVVLLLIGTVLAARNRKRALTPDERSHLLLEIRRALGDESRLPTQSKQP